MVYFLPFSRSELITLVTRELNFWAKMVCKSLFTMIPRIFSSLSRFFLCLWFCSLLAWENNRHFATSAPLVSPRNEVWASDERAQKFHIDDFPPLRYGQCFWLVVPRGKFAWTNQKNCPYLGSDTSSAWNLYVRDVAGMSAFSQASSLLFGLFVRKFSWRFFLGLFLCELNVQKRQNPLVSF